MAFESSSKHIYANHAETFAFTKDVFQFVVGISGFSLKFSGGSHAVKTMSISLSSNQLDARHISVTALATLDDHHGHHIDNGSSYVDVSVLAWNGMKDYAPLTLANVTGIPTAGTNKTTNVNEKSGRPVFRQMVLSGFKFGYTNDDYSLQQVTIAVGSNINGSLITPTVTAAMIGTSSTAADCYGDGGLICLCQKGSGLLATSYDRASTGTCEFVSPSAEYQYIAFMTGFDLRYKSKDHNHVDRISASLNLDNKGTASVDAYMMDRSNNQATTARVGGVTFGYPKPKPS